MQNDWVSSTEYGLKTGVLVWDLSAAIDTLGLLCQKLAIYGCDTKTYFDNFLSQPQPFLAKFWPHGCMAKIKSSLLFYLNHSRNCSRR